MSGLLDLIDRARAASKRNPQILENFLSLGVIQVLAYAIPLITLPYQLRVVGIERYGILAVANALIQYFVLATDYGFRISAAREISICRDDPARLNRIVGAVMAVKAGLAALSAGALIVLTATTQRFGEHALVEWLSFGLVISNLLTLTWFFQGIEQMRYITWLSIGGRVAFATALLTLVRKPEDYVLIPALASGSEILAGLTGLWVARVKFGVRPRAPGWMEIGEQARHGWHVFLSTVAINAYAATPTFAIGLFTGATAAGYYSVAEKLSQIYQTFPLASLLQALYPRLSLLHTREPRRSYRLMQTAQRYTTLAYVATYPAVALLSPVIVRLISGRTAREVEWAFILMAAAVVAINANAFQLQYLLVSGRHALYSKIHVVLGLMGSVAVFGTAWLFSYLGPPAALILVSTGVLLWTTIEVRRLRPAAGAET